MTINEEQCTVFMYLRLGYLEQLFCIITTYKLYGAKNGGLSNQGIVSKLQKTGYFRSHLGPEEAQET